MQVSILGSTGSIGKQTLEVIKNLNQNGYNIKIKALSANKNISLLKKQILEFKPEFICICDDASLNKFKKEILNDIGFNIKIIDLLELASLKVDLLINAIVGFAGLEPTVMALNNKNNIALANKESLVMAGKIIMAQAKKNNIKIMPIDSEHSAIFQALQGNDPKEIKNIYLTASGGPFHEYKTYKDLENISVEEAINHPTWRMGKKISVDSATMINKGFEILEAYWLFGVDINNIKVLVHRQSLVHSMVEYQDGNIIAQLGPSDMRLPIQYALAWPKRIKNDFARLDFLVKNKLSFEEPNKNLIGIELAKQAIKIGGTMPAVFCIANDLAVEKFLSNKYLFVDIYRFIKYAMDKYKDKIIFDYDLKDILTLRNEIKNLSFEFK